MPRQHKTNRNSQTLKKKQASSKQSVFFRSHAHMAVTVLIMSAAVIAAGLVYQRVTAAPGDPGQFVAECAYSHTLNDDPIVFPGQPSASHSHDFFANKQLNGTTTAATINSGTSSCAERKTDRSGYWVPTLYYNGQAMHPVSMRAYYRSKSHVSTDIPKIQPFPAGFRMIAGVATSSTPQPISVSSWACEIPGGGEAGDEQEQQEVPACPNNRLRLRIVFPSCWNGKDLDSPDHKSHMAYSVNKRCPASHPVPVPELTFSIRYTGVQPKSAGAASGVTLSCLGRSLESRFCGHADFFNGWPDKLQNALTEKCIKGGVNCDVTSPELDPCTGDPGDGKTCRTPIPAPALKPTIRFFRPVMSPISQGNRATLEWDVANASTCNVSPGSGTQRPAVSKEDTAPLNTVGTNTFTLNCVGSGGSATATTVVAVNTLVRPPQILGFVASPSAIKSGSASNLSWESTDSTSCEIAYGTNKAATLPAVGSLRTVALTTNTTARLTCTNSSGAVTATTDIAVSATPRSHAPQIVSFTATPASVKSGQRIKLSWVATNTGECRLSNVSVSAFPAQASYTLGVKQSTTFTLTCRKHGQPPAVKTVDVKVATALGSTRSFAAALLPLMATVYKVEGVL